MKIAAYATGNAPCKYQFSAGCVGEAIGRQSIFRNLSRGRSTAALNGGLGSFRVAACLLAAVCKQKVFARAVLFEAATKTFLAFFLRNLTVHRTLTLSFRNDQRYRCVVSRNCDSVQKAMMKPSFVSSLRQAETDMPFISLLNIENNCGLNAVWRHRDILLFIGKASSFELLLQAHVQSNGGALLGAFSVRL